MRYSLLDLSPILQGSTVAESFRNSLDLAQHAERWGYTRYWLAEHHNIPSVASAATSTLLAYIGAGTKTIRIGSGGIMLPNHAPLIIAEQFGTLEALYPGRVDLVLGRAPGGDTRTTRALRRNPMAAADTFPQDVLELQQYLSDRTPDTGVFAVPGHGAKTPIYLLGSSDFSATLAAQLGMPFAFASHFAPDALHPALAIYHSTYQPSDRHPEPYAMMGVNIIAADTDEEAARLATTLHQAFLAIIRGMRAPIPPPAPAVNWSPAEKAHVLHMTKYTLVGSPATLRHKVTDLLSTVKVDELIVTGTIHDHEARLRSFELAAKVLSSD